MTKLKVAFRNFAKGTQNTPVNYRLSTDPSSGLLINIVLNLQAPQNARNFRPDERLLSCWLVGWLFD